MPPRRTPCAPSAGRSRGPRDGARGLLRRHSNTKDTKCARSHARPVDPANTQLGVAKRVAGDIGYCLGLGPKSVTREVAGSAFCPLTRVTPPAIVCWIDRSGVRVARRALA